MDIDIGLWLTLAVAISGVIWLADRRWRWHKSSNKLVRETVEFTNSLLPVFLIVLVVRSFIVEPFKIPSGSMLPTLEVHDFILVNKFTYGLRLPVTHSLVVPLGEPQRGDVLVFRYPRNPKQNYIKRVLGLPGDEIVQRQGLLTVNGQPIPRDLQSREMHGNLLELVFAETSGEQKHLARYEVRLDPVTGEPMTNALDNSWQVPEGHYFVAGDNRNNSSDSRVWGFVPETHIVGQAFMIWMHWESLFSLPEFHRNGAIDKLEAIQ